MEMQKTFISSNKTVSKAKILLKDKYKDTKIRETKIIEILPYIQVQNQPSKIHLFGYKILNAQIIINDLKNLIPNTQAIQEIQLHLNLSPKKYKTMRSYFKLKKQQQFKKQIKRYFNVYGLLFFRMPNSIYPIREVMKQLKRELNFHHKIFQRQQLNIFFELVQSPFLQREQENQNYQVRQKQNKQLAIDIYRNNQYLLEKDQSKNSNLLFNQKQQKVSHFIQLQEKQLNERKNKCCYTSFNTSYKKSKMGMNFLENQNMRSGRNNNYEKQLKIKNEYSNQEQIFFKKVKGKKYNDKLLGGGCGTSNIRSIGDAQKIEEKKDLNEDDMKKLKQEFILEDSLNENGSDIEDEDQLNNSQIMTFDQSYKHYYKTYLPKLNETETYVRLIIERTIYEFREGIADQNRVKMVDMINLVINYVLIIIQNNLTRSIDKDIQKINKYLEELRDYCYENRNRYPTLEVYQYFDILIALNSQRQGLDKINQSKILKAFKLILQVVKFGAGFVSIAGAVQNLTNISLKDLDNFKKQLKEIFEDVKQSVQNLSEQGKELYDYYNKGSISKKICTLWQRKMQIIGEDLLKIYDIQSIDFEQIQSETQFQDILFYLNEIREMNSKNSEDITLFVFMQVNYLLCKQKQKDKEFIKFSEKLKNENKQDLILDFANLLQNNTYLNSIFQKIQSYANLIVTNEKYRYLKTLILLHFAQIIKKLDNIEEYRKIMIHLCSNYLQEKQISLNILFKGNQQMAEFIHNKYYYDQIIEESKRIKQIYIETNKEEQVNQFVHTISNQEDIEKLLAKKYVQMWEISVKQRQDQNKIAHKDDALLEAVHLYIQQNLTYQLGYNFNKQHQDRANNEQLINLDLNDQTEDSIKLIVDHFLIPNFKQEHKNQQQQNQCKVLSILAEGGSGKSMLLKKLEVELLKEKGDSKYRQDERSNYLPFIIKCNSLDQQNPSIDNYLKAQNKDFEQNLEILKKSERNKLIMLDGYDEFTGDYFKIYQALKYQQ